MKKTITTEGIQSQIYELSKSFVEFVEKNTKFTKDTIELKLLLYKINSNIQRAALLWSRGIFLESKIIIRSAFETLVLFEYLIYYPDKVQIYKNDNLIINFQNLFGFHIRGYCKTQKLIKAYKTLPKHIRDIIPYKTTNNVKPFYDVDKLKDYFSGGRNGFRPLSQRTIYMIEELKKTGSENSKKLSEYQLTMYNMTSQISHSTLDTIIESTKNLEDIVLLERMQDCARDTLIILATISSTLIEKLNYKEPIKMYGKFGEIMTYLNFKVLNTD